MHTINRSYPWLLFFFVLLYPLIFFPGALFFKPEIIGPLDKSNASEQFLHLPKLLVLVTVAVLGLLDIRRSFSKSVFSILLFTQLTLVVLSTLNAHDELAYNLLGPTQRFDGVIYQFCLVVIGLWVYTSLKESPRSFRQITIALVLGSCIQTLIVLLQRLGLDPVTPLWLWQSFDKPLGTLGHPGMVAAFLLPSLLVSIFSGFGESLNRSKYIWMAASLFVATGLGITGNTSAFLGIIVVLVWLNIIYRNWEFLIISCLIILAILVPRALLPNPKGFEANLQAYQSTTTLKTRLAIWQLSVNAMRHIPFQPILGGGPDALRLAQLKNPPFDLLMKLYAVEFSWPKDAVVKNVFIKKYPGEQIKARDKWIGVEFSRFDGQSNVTREFGFIIDRAHNYLLDRWVAFGLLNAIIWLVLYGFPIWQSIGNKHWLGWIFVALGIYYLAWFPVMQVEPIHVVLLASAWALFSSSRSTHET